VCAWNRFDTFTGTILYDGTSKSECRKLLYSAPAVVNTASFGRWHQLRPGEALSTLTQYVDPENHRMVVIKGIQENATQARNAVEYVTIHVCVCVRVLTIP